MLLALLKQERKRHYWNLAADRRPLMADRYMLAADR
jgi:hypothetical protein